MSRFWNAARRRSKSRAFRIVGITSALAGLTCLTVPAHAQTANGGTGRSLFAEIGKTQSEIDTKVNTTYADLFGGKNTIYYEVRNKPEAYIYDTGNGDVRSEGMGYGMMITLQMNDKAKFDKLWAFAYNNMLHKDGQWKGYFCWQATKAGACIDQGPAPDGESYMAASLYMAARRWGNGTGIYNYQVQADAITDAMLNHEALVGGTPGGVVSMINANNYIVFAPIGDAALFTDPSYHTPHLFQLFSQRATVNQARWAQVASVSRSFLASTPYLPRDAAGQYTCLTPEYSNFDGTPKAVSYNSNSTRFYADAWRTLLHAGLDYEWWRGHSSQPGFAKCLLAFFTSKADANHVYPARWELNGVPYGNTNRWTGLAGANAGGVLATVNTTASEHAFIEDFWKMPTVSGRYRYYDGLLQMFGMLAASDRYKAH